MYANDTILALKEQRDADPETGEDFPYNRVRVVGPSPVAQGSRGDWTGEDANGVIVVPLTNFGSTLDEPYGKLKHLYEVESIPEAVTEVTTTVRTYDATTAAAGPTPEEVFAEKAPGKPAAPDAPHRRARSPLGETKNPEVSGPLGEVEAPAPEPPPSSDANSPL